MNRLGGEEMECHVIRFTGGLGAIFLIYAPIRILENHAAIWSIILIPIMAYCFGFILYRINQTTDTEGK